MKFKLKLNFTLSVYDIYAVLILLFPICFSIGGIFGYYDEMIGFHSHNNMNLAFITARDILEYATSRRLVIDCSLYGMGRGAGNLNTELITNYYNNMSGKKYDII